MHELVKELLSNRNYRGPVRRTLTSREDGRRVRILDIGTVNGRWCVASGADAFFIHAPAGWKKWQRNSRIPKYTVSISVGFPLCTRSLRFISAR